MRECKGCHGLIFESASTHTTQWVHVHRADAERCDLLEAGEEPAPVTRRKTS